MHYEELKIPEEALFEDYSGLSIQDNRIVIVSQASSLLWIGELKRSEWGWVDEGRVYGFPEGKDGKQKYFNIEGVSWTGANRLVLVSDKRKPSQPKRAKKKDQSIHIFEVMAR